MLRLYLTNMNMINFVVLHSPITLITCPEPREIRAHLGRTNLPRKEPNRCWNMRLSPSPVFCLIQNRRFLWG